MWRPTEGQYVLGIGTIFSFWILMVLPFLYGPPPRFAEASRPPQAHSDNSAQDSQKEPRGTVDAPIIVKVLPTPKTTEEADQEAKERNDKSSTDRWLMIFTGAVAVFTFMLVGATVLLYRSGEKQIKLIGQRVDLSRDEYVSTHRPRIVLRDVYLIADSVHYTLVNIGDTRAIIVESRIFAEIVESGNLFTLLRSTGYDDLGLLQIAAGESRENIYPIPADVNFWIKRPEARKPTINGEVYFVGIIIYSDDISIKRRSVFRRRWNDARVLD
jgi:hypothetical protein